ncbi:MAG: transporter substrate-binding domain-containing protein [Nitratireductor sp.]|nr:transporter substrate-binding domain-containing protein [Nitratireductor sp.]
MACIVMCLLALAGASVLPARPAMAESVTIPNFWDPGERLAKPDIDGLPRLRFLTTTDFPPFNFIDRKRRLAGFHVDLARAICTELAIMAKCQIQAVPWDELETALDKGEGEAILAGLEMTPETVSRYEFSRTYFRVPARFVIRRDESFNGTASTALRSAKTGIITGSRHAAWFVKAFPRLQSQAFASRREALDALQQKKVDAVFSDAVSLSFWLQSDASADCCKFVDGPYLSDEDFGADMAIAFSRGNADLVNAVNYALKEINDKGIFAELYLRYFPLGLF